MTASGPFAATLTVVYGATAFYAGCTFVNTYTGQTWQEGFSATNGQGTIYVTGGSCTSVASGCTNTSQNGTATSCYGSITGGSDMYTIEGDVMTSVGNGLDYETTSTTTYMKQP
jgi:hypothetical protein